GSRAVLQQLAGTDASTTSSVGKLLAMGIGQSIAEFVVDQLGPAGVAAVPGQPSDKAIEQLLAGRATTIYGGTTEVQLNVIAERMVGLPRDGPGRRLGGGCGGGGCGPRSGRARTRSGGVRVGPGGPQGGRPAPPGARAPAQ